MGFRGLFAMAFGGREWKAGAFLDVKWLGFVEVWVLYPGAEPLRPLAVEV